MKQALTNEPWRNLLPDVIDWLEAVQVSVEKAAAEGAHYVVAVKAADDDKDKIELQAANFDQVLKQKIAEAAGKLGWRPSAGSLTLSVENKSYTLVPMSSVKASERQRARQLGLDAARATRELKLPHLALWGSDGLSGLDIFEGYAAGLYTQGNFKGTRKKDISRLPGKVTLVGASPKEAQQVLEMAKAQAYTRFLQDAPGNYMNPVRLGDIAEDWAKELGLKCKILGKEQMEALGMGSFLSVSAGGPIEPRLIAIEVDGHDNSKCVALVGKGLTFDSGGISIKAAPGMEEMKYDMSGGAAVLGTARFLSKVKPPVKVICLVGASENMPSGTATKPGDIVKAMNGKTVEVLNTDAEGRLVLADVLSYAVSEYKPEMVIDIATLTGAVLMALGCVGAAVMSNDQGTASYMLQAGEAEGEPLWQLPLWPELEKETKSDIADFKNIAKGSVKGGTIMGGMFLKEFVGNTKWAHLDIAGTGWNCQALGYPSSGGSAFGLKTLVSACLRFNK